MKISKNYSEYFSILNELTKQNKNDLAWINDPADTLYDFDLILSRTQKLEHYIAEKDIHSLMFVVSSGLVRNLGGITTAALYTKVPSRTKECIIRYVKSMVDAIKMIQETENVDIPKKVKDKFLKDSLQTFGRSGLVLFGGALYGTFHLGLVKCLLQLNLLPRVICGMSTGAVIAGLLCSRKIEYEEDVAVENFNYSAFDLEVQETKLSGRGSLRRKVARLLKHGVLMDIHVLEKFTKDNLGNITFEEAFKISNRELNIIVYSDRKHEKPFVLNWKTAPNVLIWSAACSSCAIPGLYEGVPLCCKKTTETSDVVIDAWTPSLSFAAAKWKSLLDDPSSTGNIEKALKLSRISELFNVNHFIVSHINPYIVINPVLFLWKKAPAVVFNVTEWIAAEISHWLNQLNETGLIPMSIARLQRYFTTLQGHINIYPLQEWTDFAKIFEDLNRENLGYFVEKGEKSTWPLVSLLYASCAIEAALEEAVRDGRGRPPSPGSSSNEHPPLPGDAF